MIAEQTQRQAVCSLDKVVRISLRTDENRSHGLVPKDAQHPPTGRHHIIMCRCAGRNQKPFVADGLKGIFAAYEADVSQSLLLLNDDAHGDPIGRYDVAGRHQRHQRFAHDLLHRLRRSRAFRLRQAICRR